MMLRVSVPILGIIFLSKNKRKTLLKRLKVESFRPHIGDYFFISNVCQSLKYLGNTPVSVPILGIIFLSRTIHASQQLDKYIEFPSPYWGLFFYRGDYCIFCCGKPSFPSPYWGLFFYPIIQSITNVKANTVGFPSPYWGLFFYQSI